MASIRTQIQLNDMISSPLMNISNALNMTINSFEEMESAASGAFNSSNFDGARQYINAANIELNEMTQNLNNNQQEQEELNQSLRNGTNAASGLQNKIIGMVGAYASIQGLKKVLDLSDTMTSNTARLDLMNDGLQTTAELQDMINQSANASRTSYIDTAAAVSKLGLMAGDAFESNQEMVAFAEQMNKQFKIGGSSVQEQTSAMYQLTQAMAAGKLQGDEFRSILENAPMLAKSIAEYMGLTTGELKEMSSQGLITSDIIKNSMFAAADETNAKFAQLPMTFSQVGTVIGNTMLQTFEPALQVIGQGAQFIYDNWSTIEPIFWGLTAAVGAYAIGLGIQTAATWLATEAAQTFFTTLLTNPVTWIALGIGILIGALYKWVQAVGGVDIAWKIAMNGILTAWDWTQIGIMTGVYGIVNFLNMLQIGFMTASVNIQNFMGDMKSGVLNILQDMVNGSIGIINDFINKLNNIPGVAIDTIQQVTFGTNASLENDAAQQVRNRELNNSISGIEAGIASRDAALEQMKFNAINASAQRQVEINAAQAAKAVQQEGGVDFSSLYDTETYNNIADIAANTGNMKDSIDISSEDLKYMRDTAEMETINRFTTAEIKVDMVNNNNINNEMDIDGVVDRLGEGVNEAMENAARGVHD